MPTYLCSTTDASGIKQVLRIEAASLAEARIRLLENGNSELTFHNEDFTASLRTQSDSLDKLSPQAELQMRNRGRIRPREIILKSLQAPPLLYILLIGSLCWSVYSGDYLIFLAICIIYLMAIGSLLFLGIPAFYFDRLLTAREWQRWDDVLKLANKLEGISRRTKGGIPSSAFIFYRSQALAASGDLAQAIQVFQQIKANESIPRWVHLAQLANIYAVAKAFDDAISTFREAITLNPRCGSLYLFLAELLIFRKRDVSGARQAIGETESLEIVDLAAPMVKFCKGAIELESGNFSSALNFLNQALDGFQQIKRQPLMFQYIQGTKAYLCLAYSHLGKKAIGAQLFNEVQAFLKAIREHELLQRCEMAVRTGER